MVTVSEPVYYNPWPAAVLGLGPAVRSVGAVGAGIRPRTSNQSYPIFTHLLGVRITERASGKEVYNVTARNSGGESSLVRAMPYLARSALADFPLGNGVVHTVKIPVGQSGGGIERNGRDRYGARRRTGAGVRCESRSVNSTWVAVRVQSWHR